MQYWVSATRVVSNIPKRINTDHELFAKSRNNNFNNGVLDQLK